MARRKSHEEHENHERWLVSYADFITLLFAFFVVMYAISSVNEGKYRVLSDALVAAFRSPAKSLEPIQIGNPVKSPYTNDPTVVRVPKTFIPSPIRLAKPPVELPLPQQAPRRPIQMPVGSGKRIASDLEKMTRELEDALEDLVKQDLVTVRGNTLWIEVEIKNSILFSSGSAALEPTAIPMLEKIANILRPFPNFIQVEGFTDNVPITTVAYPSNWELSAGRSASVVHLFTKLNISPRRMAAIGYGEHRPNADNDTSEGRQKNRRVVLVILANPDMERILAFRHAILADPKSNVAVPETTTENARKARDSKPDDLSVGSGSRRSPG